MCLSAIEHVSKFACKGLAKRKISSLHPCIEFDQDFLFIDNADEQGQGDRLEQGQGERAEQNPEKAARTAFVSNLSYSIEEDGIGKIFREVL